VNAYYAVYLYALATANVDLTHFSHLLLSMEVQATQFYWHMPNDDIYDSVFSASRMAGNIGALDVTASTWFGSELEYVHGINLYVQSPSSTAFLFLQLSYLIVYICLHHIVHQCQLSAPCYIFVLFACLHAFILHEFD
jgi:Glycosyl hydrolase family 81 C-terminal domain